MVASHRRYTRVSSWSDFDMRHHSTGARSMRIEVMFSYKYGPLIGRSFYVGGGDITAPTVAREERDNVETLKKGGELCICVVVNRE